MAQPSVTTDVTIALQCGCDEMGYYSNALQQQQQHIEDKRRIYIQFSSETS